MSSLEFINIPNPINSPEIGLHLGGLINILELPTEILMKFKVKNLYPGYLTSSKIEHLREITEKDKDRFDSSKLEILRIHRSSSQTLSKDNIDYLFLLNTLPIERIRELDLSNSEPEVNYQF